MQQFHDLLVGVAADELVLHLQHPGPALEPAHLGQPIHLDHGPILVYGEPQQTRYDTTTELKQYCLTQKDIVRYKGVPRN